MKWAYLVMIAVLVALATPAPVSFAKGRDHKIRSHVERVSLINNGQEIRIDPIPNRIPDFSAFRAQLIDLAALEPNVPHRARRSSLRFVSLAQRQPPQPFDADWLSGSQNPRVAARS